MFQMELTHCCGQETFVTSVEGEGFNTYQNISQRTKFCYIDHSKIQYSHMEDSYDTVLYKASHRSAV